MSVFFINFALIRKASFSQNFVRKFNSLNYTHAKLDNFNKHQTLPFPFPIIFMLAIIKYLKLLFESLSPISPTILSGNVVVTECLAVCF